MSSRIAIIDIGTNTINLLVAEPRTDGSYDIACSAKETPRLGEGSFVSGKLTPEAITRALQALQRHQDRLAALDCTQVHCYATSAVRSAKNGTHFVQAVQNQLGWQVNVINGDQEAALVFDGVKQVVPIGRERVLVLDIGGGSSEFIIGGRDGVLFRQSYDIGMVRMLDLFTLDDPVTDKQVRDMETHIRRTLADPAQNLYDALRAHPTTTLIGTSGSFDTLAALVAAKNHPMLDVHLSTSYEISLELFEETYRRLLHSTKDDRQHMPRLDPERVQLIIPGIIMIHMVIAELRMERLYQCGFSLKHGALAHHLNQP